LVHFKIQNIDAGINNLVTYQPPLGFIGAIANSLTIKNKLRDIFYYRANALEKRFGKFEL